jgi:uncharacterized membrane protein
MHGIAAVLEGNVVAVYVRRKKDFRVPRKALAGGKLGDQSRRTLWVADVNDSAFLLRKRRAQKAWATVVQGLVLPG